LTEALVEEGVGEVGDEVVVGLEVEEVVEEGSAGGRGSGRSGSG